MTAPASARCIYLKCIDKRTGIKLLVKRLSCQLSRPTISAFPSLLVFRHTCPSHALWTIFSAWMIMKRAKSSLEAN
jgi:hypothetical protein